MRILKHLSQNARVSTRDLSVMCGLSEEEVETEIAEMERAGLIRGYKAVIDWGKLDSAKVSAVIELKVTPEADNGFEKIADEIRRYPEVESVYLMSGAYDFSVVVKANTFEEVCMFVAKRLAPMKRVTSTATHFVLRRYKEMDIDLCSESDDDRRKMSL